MRHSPISIFFLLATLWLAACSHSTAAPTSSTSQPSPPPRYDLVIDNARIVDGTGNAWFRGDVGILDGRIAAVGILGAHTSKRRIDAADRVLTPGFIDMMGQESLVLVQDRAAAESHLRQGITTLFCGEGVSHAPQNAMSQPEPVMIGGQARIWTRYAEYFAILEEHGIAMNVVHNVGATQVRGVVMGFDDRAPTSDELDQMRALVDQAMRDGAVGLSTALIYPPATYASTEELIALSEVVAHHGGFYATHMRSEGDGLLPSIDETLRIGREAGLPAHIFHLKAGGVNNWPDMQTAVDKIDAARRGGQDVTADIYPYIRSGTGLAAFVPPWHHADGPEQLRRQLASPSFRNTVRGEIEQRRDWENIYLGIGSDWDRVLITSTGGYANTSLTGLSIAEAAAQTDIEVWTLFFDLVAAGDVRIAPQSMNEEQKRIGLRAPWMMVDTDTRPTNPAAVRSAHPRAFGAFPRILAKYVREDALLTLEDAIRRMTSQAAHRLGLHDRGLIAPGMAADLVLFDPNRIRDTATFAEPLQYAEGVDYLLINGVPVIDDGRLTEALPGHVLRHRSALQEDAS